MNDPFSSSRQKIDWAEKRLNELQREINEFLARQPYERVTEPDPNEPSHQVHKIKLTESLPPSIANITSEVAQNLRNTLDNAGYSVAIAAGGRTQNTNFPFASSLKNLMKHSIARSADLPKEIQSLFCGFQPYLGGDSLLWALNEIAVGDKHKYVIPVGQGAYSQGVSVRGTGYFSMPDAHVWDRTKNEMVIITLGPGAEYNCHFNFRLFVAFHDIKVVDGKPIVPVLMGLGGKVVTIIDTIAAECKRLRIIKS